MTPIFRAFRPLAATQATAVTNVNQTVNLNLNNGYRAVRFVNSGTDIVWINFFGAAAIGTGVPLPGGQTEVFTVPKDISSYGVITTAAGTNTLYSTVGEGI